MTGGRLTPQVVLWLTTAPLMWAANAVVGRAMVGEVPPLMLNAMRWTLALALLLVLGRTALASPEARAGLRARWRELTLLGLLGVGLYNAFQYAALTTSTPLNVTLIAASSPVWMLAVGGVFYGERPARRQLMGALLSAAGVLVVLARGDMAALAGIELARGDLLMLGGVVSWAFYSWQLARPPARLRGADRPAWGWAEFVLVQVLFGIGWTWLMAGAEWAVAPAPVVWSWGVVAAVVFVAVGPSVIAYRCWAGGVAAAGPAVAALFSNLTPVFAAVLAGGLLGEWPKGYHLAAFALIVAGIAVSTPRR